MENLKAKSFDLRKDTVDIIVAGKGGHIGGDMSVIDTLMSLYFCQMNISPENMDDPDRDRFVLSKVMLYITMPCLFCTQQRSLCRGLLRCTCSKGLSGSGRY